jgi:hypothetical protein
MNNQNQYTTSGRFKIALSGRINPLFMNLSADEYCVMEDDWVNIWD